MIERFASPEEAAAACGRQILAWLEEAIEQRGRAALAVSGGSSPQIMFEGFARASFDWDRVHIFWVDERAVPPNDPQSNFKLANDAWLAPAGFPETNVHRIHAELPPPAAAESYIADIRAFFELSSGQLPRFDVIHRGMGPDAHTASLFPGEPLIADRAGIAAAVWVEKFHQWRITLLPGVLFAARHTAMLVTGADKAEALGAVLHAPLQPLQYPAQIMRNADWFLDAAAAIAAQ